MAKRKVTIELESFGIYTKWDKSKKKELPKLIKVTTDVPAVKDTEFGIIAEIKGGKGKSVDFIIKHPKIYDADGNLRPDFSGEIFINSNNYRCFIGDGLWEPVNELCGEWAVELYFQDNLIINKKFLVSAQ